MYSFKGAKPTLQALHSPKPALLRPGWKARTDQKGKGRNSCHIYDGNFVNKSRKDAGTSVSSSAFFVYVIALTINRQGNVKPEKRLIYLFKTIHY